MPDGDPKSKKTSVPSKPMLSIRARLIVLALLAIAPLMIERVHGLEEARAIRTERANNDVVELARRGAESQRQIIYSVRSLLQIVSRVYAKVPLDSSNCSQYLADLMTNIPWIRDLSIASDDGRIKCSTQPLALGLNVSDRLHFQNALAAREFALSDYMINRSNDVPSVVATYPIIKNDGSLSGVVLAVINLQWIGDLAATAAQHSGAAVLLLDSAGTLVAGSADQQAYIGKRFTGSELARQMLANDNGTVTVAGLDGIQRIFAYVRVPWTQARLAVGLDESAVHAGIDHEIGVAYLQLVAFGLFVLLVAWFGGEQLVVRPIRSLVRTATRFGRGDLHVRATQEPWVAEFAPLAAALDDMAAKLAAREEELQIANRHLDELASLDGLSGLANRRGFDREIEREWQKAAESQQAAGADDGRYRSLQAVQRSLRPRLRRHLLARRRRDAVARDIGRGRAGGPLRRRGIRAAVAGARYQSRRGARGGGAAVHRRSDDQSLGIADGPRHHQHRRRLDGSGQISELCQSDRSGRRRPLCRQAPRP